MVGCTEGRLGCTLGQCGLDRVGSGEVGRRGVRLVWLIKKERMSSGPSQIVSESLTMLNKVPNEFTVITIGNQPEVQKQQIG